MIRSKALRQFAVYSISLPSVVAASKVAKETVYMPSAVAARVLGSAAPADAQPQADGDPVSADS